MELNNKHLRIIEALKQHNVAAERLSHIADISQRSLTNYVPQINHYFAGVFMIVKEYQVFSSFIHDENKFTEKLKIEQQRIQNDEETQENQLGAVFLYLLKEKQ